MIAFTYPWGKLVKSIMLLDGVSGEALQLEDDRFKFKYTLTVVVKKDLYAFKFASPVSAYKIADFTSTDRLVTDLSTLPRSEGLEGFAVSFWAAAGSIILTGGYCGRSDEKFSAQTFLLAVQTGQWEQRSFPDLNVARAEHSSMSQGNQCYVAGGCVDGGVGNDDENLSSVEMLRLGAQTWELIEIPGLTPRCFPIISQIDT